MGGELLLLDLFDGATPPDPGGPGIQDIISVGIGYGGTPRAIITRGLSMREPDVFSPVQAWSADGYLVEWSAAADKVIAVEWTADGDLVEWSA